MNKGTFAVITGASQGLGRCFALEMAKTGSGVILVSLPQEGADKLATEIRGYGVEAHVYETDLTVKANIVALAEWINASFQVNLLINNAGMGGSKGFLASNLEYLERMINLNVAAPVMLTRLLLENLSRNMPAHILNVASVASFSPIGYKTIYPASKRFIQHFSLGLNEELRGKGVRVSVTFPGPMKTNIDVTKRIESQGYLANLYAMSAERVAQISLRQLRRGRKSIYPGWSSRLTWLFAKLAPEWICLPWLSKVARREINVN